VAAACRCEDVVCARSGPATRARPRRTTRRMEIDPGMEVAGGETVGGL
jgi:hypothetical protein